jgi:hypothetical protein
MLKKKGKGAGGSNGEIHSDDNQNLAANHTVEGDAHEEESKDVESETSDIDAAEKKSNDSKDVAKPRGAASEERKGGG